MSIRNLCLALLAGGAMAMAPPLISSVEAQDVVTDEMLLTAQEDPNNWLMAIGNYTGNRYSKLSQVNTSNVRNLVPKWIFSLGTLDAQNTTPVVHNGIMYVTAAHGRTYALDAEKGTEIWRYAHELPEGVGGNMCCDIGNRGVALFGDKVFVATPDAHVVALNMKNRRSGLGQDRRQLGARLHHDRGADRGEGQRHRRHVRRRVPDPSLHRGPGRGDRRAGMAALHDSGPGRARP